MIRIGILSVLHKDKLQRCLKSILYDCTCIEKAVNSELLYALEQSGVNFCIVDPEKVDCYVDILILDCADNSLIKKSLKSISPNTRLLYNSDRYPTIIHPYAVGYGFSENSTVTVSSVNEDDSGERSLMMCMHPFLRLNNTVSDECEYLVHFTMSKINDVLCSVACAELCGAIHQKKLTLI